MRYSYKVILPVIVAVTSVFLVSACTEESNVVDREGQEKRFFDLYVVANYPDVDPRPNGLYFTEHKTGTGVSPDEDDWLLVNHVCYKVPGDIIYESYVENVVRDNRSLDPQSTALYGPYKMLNGSRNPGLTEGLMLMKEGSQATMFFTSELGYGMDGRGSVSPYQSLKYEIELLEVIQDIDAFENARIDSYIDTIPVTDTILDPASDAIMYYVIDRSTDGKPVAVDSVVQLAYKGYLMDGRVFDEATEEDPFEITVGSADLIKGWELGLMKLKEGEKARFIIPYQLAYGEDGSEHPTTGLRTIPPYETLLFDIQIISVKEDLDS